MLNRFSILLKRSSSAVPKVTNISMRSFSQVKPPVSPPDEFFDDEVENDKEFLDIATSIYNGGIENITTVNKTLTWDKLESARDEQLDFELPQESTEVYVKPDEEEKDKFLFSPRGKLLINVLSNQDVGDHVSRFRAEGIVPTERMNYTIPWNKRGQYNERPLSKFLSRKAPERYTDLNQGLRACPGKLQRHGPTPVLRCHKIDLDAVNHMDVMTLRKYLSADAEIMSRRKTGLCAKCQRQVAKTIKRARHMSILPHIGDYEIQEVRPVLQREEFHDAVNADAHYMPSTTILK